MSVGELLDAWRLEEVSLRVIWWEVVSVGALLDAWRDVEFLGWFFVVL